MSSLSSWLWGTTQLDDAVDKATSELLPTDAEDIALNLEICDQIRSKSVPAKDAMRALKRRLNHKNPNVQLLALGLTDICIKNGGDQFLTEVASREFMDNLVSILKIPGLNMDVKNRMLRLVQNWAVAFEGKALLSYVGQVYKTLKSEGFNFPPQDLVVANSAMVDTQTAPEWVDSDICLRCRDPFTFTNRKHHCRNCGQVFDQKCSSKMIPLPHFGITQDVRVCDSCFAKLGKKGERAPGVDKSHRRSASAHSSRHRSARELADAELQRAIQLSLESSGLTSRRSGYVPYQPSPNSWYTSEPPLVDRSSHPYAVSDRKSPEPDEDDDPDLKAAIEASLREANAPKPSAPIVLETPRSEEPSFTFGRGPGYSQSYPPTSIPEPSVPKLPNYDLEPLESDVILTFSQTVEQVQAQGGRDVSKYPAVNELFDKANGLRPKLAMSLDDTGRKEQMLAEMHEKLSQAVKLYDQLLTQQISHPAWRSPYQRSGSTYGQPSNQWVPVSPQAPPMAPTNYQQQVQSPVPPVPVQTQLPQTSLTRAQTFPQGADNAQQPWYPQPTQFSEEPYQTPYAQPPSQFTTQAPMQSPTTYNSTTNGVSVASPPPPPFYPTQSPSLPMLQSPAPVSQSQHSPQQLPSAPHPVVSSPPLAPVNGYASRANTISHVPAPQQPTLPAFPVAPTTVPQSFSAYGSAIPTPQPERKEALLIDL